MLVGPNWHVFTCVPVRQCVTVSYVCVQCMQQHLVSLFIRAYVCVQVILAIDQTRLPGMKRVLEAGGAQVVGIRPPYAKFSEATHAFVDFCKLDKLNIDKVRINIDSLIR